MFPNRNCCKHLVRDFVFVFRSHQDIIISKHAPSDLGLRSLRADMKTNVRCAKLHGGYSCTTRPRATGTSRQGHETRHNNSSSSSWTRLGTPKSRNETPQSVDLSQRINPGLAFTGTNVCPSRCGINSSSTRKQNTLRFPQKSRWLASISAGELKTESGPPSCALPRQ